MKKMCLAVIAICVMVGLCFGAPAKSSPSRKTPAKKSAPAKKVPEKKPDKIFIDTSSREDVGLFTSGYIYTVRPGGIYSGSYILYFAAKDITAGKELLVKALEKSAKLVDTADRKVAKVTFSMGDSRGNVDPDYKLVLFLELRKGLPFIFVDSRFLYLGAETHACVVNWGLSSENPRSKFKYYTVPKDGVPKTFKLGPAGSQNKIGWAPWLYVHDGRGYGVGLICSGMLGKGEDFVFINSVPPQMDLSQSKYSEIFIAFMPIMKDWKRLPSLYEKIKTITWEYE